MQILWVHPPYPLFPSAPGPKDQACSPSVSRSCIPPPLPFSFWLSLVENSLPILSAVGYFFLPFPGLSLSICCSPFHFSSFSLTFLFLLSLTSITSLPPGPTFLWRADVILPLFGDTQGELLALILCPLPLPTLDVSTILFEYKGALCLLSDQLESRSGTLHKAQEPQEY